MTLTMPMTVPDYVAEWFGQLQTRPLAEAVPDPTAAAVFSADMVVGFCAHGNLASTRLGALMPRQVFLYHLALNGVEVVGALS